MITALEPLFASLASEGTEYLVIGGIAAIAYGVPRTTLNLDILIRATEANARSLLRAFERIGLGTAALTTAEDLARTEITVFQDRMRKDVQTRTPGIDFAAAHGRRRDIMIGGVPVPFISKGDLIVAKRASGRPQDLEDVRILEGES